MPLGSCGGHACAFETSVMLYLEPELVNMEKARAGFVGIPDKTLLDNMFNYGIVGISEIGVIGDPTLATAELGEVFFNAVLDEMERCLLNK
jgi:creatinine amidohydrolase